MKWYYCLSRKCNRIPQIVYKNSKHFWHYKPWSCKEQYTSIQPVVTESTTFTRPGLLNHMPNPWLTLWILTKLQCWVNTRLKRWRKTAQPKSNVQNKGSERRQQDIRDVKKFEFERWRISNKFYYIWHLTMFNLPLLNCKHRLWFTASILTVYS